jgi:hypothetical protein
MDVRSLVYSALIVVMTTPLVLAVNPIRRWLDPGQPFGRIALRVLLLLTAFIVYGLCCLWLTIQAMRWVQA